MSGLQDPADGVTMQLAPFAGSEVSDSLRRGLYAVRLCGKTGITSITSSCRLSPSKSVWGQVTAGRQVSEMQVGIAVPGLCLPRPGL